MEQPLRANLAPLRWFVAVMAILYGFAKLNGAQFTVLDSELTRPMGEVSGFWLTWYYFGRSTTYGSLPALLQIVGGILLVLPRTALAGALLLLPVFTSIVLIAVFFGIALDATLLACVVTLILTPVICLHAQRLRAALLLEPSRVNVVRIWQTWVTKGDLIMQGQLTQDGHLELASPDGVHGRLVLARERSVRGVPAN